VTDRERAAQEDILYRIKLCENLISAAKTEEKKSQYEDSQDRPRNVEAFFQGVEGLTSCKSTHESSDSHAQWRYLFVNSSKSGGQALAYSGSVRLRTNCQCPLKAADS
jgi:hypothetical protein